MYMQFALSRVLQTDIKTQCSDKQNMVKTVDTLKPCDINKNQIEDYRPELLRSFVLNRSYMANILDRSSRIRHYLL